MKAPKCVAILLACVGFSLIGCSEQSQAPVAPSDQAAQGTASLEKRIIRDFTAAEAPDLLNPAGYIIDPGFSPPHNKNKTIVRGMLLRNVVMATFLDGGTDLLSGHGVIEMNFTIDLSANEGVCWGKLTLDPDAPEAGDGVGDHLEWNHHAGCVRVCFPHEVGRTGKGWCHRWDAVVL